MSYIILKNLIGRRSDLPGGFTHSMPLSAPFPLVIKHTGAQLKPDLGDGLKVRKIAA